MKNRLKHRLLGLNLSARPESSPHSRGSLREHEKRWILILFAGDQGAEVYRHSSFTYILVVFKLFWEPVHFQPHNHSLAGRRPSLHMHRHHVVANIQSASLCHSLSFNCWGCLPSLTDYSAESMGQIMMFAQLVVLLLLSWAGSPSLAGRLCSCTRYC